MNPKKKTKQKPKKTTSKPRGVKSFQDALNFYNKTRSRVDQLISESENLHEELGDEESLLGKDGTPLPLPIDTQETMGLIDIEQWLGTSLKHYKQTLSECLPHIDKEMDVVPKLLQGLLDEAQDGTQELAKLLKKVQKEIKTSPSNPNPKELEKIEKSLNTRLHKLNFFKEEVEERFETFQDSLVDYISNYCLLEHLVNCTQWVTESQNKNITQVIKKITQFKEPF